MLWRVCWLFPLSLFLTLFVERGWNYASKNHKGEKLVFLCNKLLFMCFSCWTRKLGVFVFCWICCDHRVKIFRILKSFEKQFGCCLFFRKITTREEDFPPPLFGLFHRRWEGQPAGNHTKWFQAATAMQYTNGVHWLSLLAPHGFPWPPTATTGCEVVGCSPCPRGQKAPRASLCLGSRVWASR